MSHSLRDPYGKNPPCRLCEHWGFEQPGTPHVICLYGGRQQVHADGEHGCAFWVRATGSDDEPAPRPLKQLVMAR